MVDFLAFVVAMFFAIRLLVDAATTPHAQASWRRPFGSEVPPRDISFDIAGGIVLPLLCFVADPIVFKAPLFGSPLLGHFALFAYLTIGIAMQSLVLWLVCRRPAALFAGVLTASALFAFVLGVILLPLSFAGVFMAGIGILGLSPFVTALVFWRNARQAWACAREGGTRVAWTVPLATACGFLVASSGPLLAHVYVEQQGTRATELAISADTTEATQGIARLRHWHSILDNDRLVWLYAAEKDDARRTRLAEVYRTLTGGSITERLAVLRD